MPNLKCFGPASDGSPGVTLSCGCLCVALAVLVGSSPASSAESEPTVITLIHMNDLHANLVPHLDVVRSETPVGVAKSLVVERGGLARIATVIRGIREENPHSLLMNIGDTYHGGVEALYTRGNAIVAPVNTLGIDVGVPGNWDCGRHLLLAHSARL